MKRWLIVLGLLLLCGCIEDNANFSDEELLAVFSQLGSGSGGVYVGGGYAVFEDKQLGPEGGPSTKPCYWIDGVLHELPMPDGYTEGYLISLARESGHTYAIGVLYGTTSGKPALWIDDILQPGMLAEFERVYQLPITVKNGTVHAIVRSFAGEWYWNSNGVNQKLTEHWASAATLLQKGEKLLWAGMKDSKAYLFELPMGGGTENMTELPAPTANSRAYHVFIDGSDIYASGYYRNASNQDIPGYWKNGGAFTPAYGESFSCDNINSIYSGMINGELVSVTSLAKDGSSSVFAGTSSASQKVGVHDGYDIPCSFKNNNLIIAGLYDATGTYYLQGGEKYDLQLPATPGYAVAATVWVD